MKRIAPFLFVCMMAAACLSDPDCLITSTGDMQLRFVNSVRDSLVGLEKVTMTGSDSVLYEKDTTAVLTLPINKSAVSTTFYIYYASRKDSLVVGYVPKYLIISPECGAFIFYTELSVLSTSFANVSVVEKQLLTSVKTNVKITL